MDTGTLQDVHILERGASGRVLKILISTTSGDYTFERDTIRWVLGKLKSTLFSVQRVDEKDGSVAWLFTGGGWGHAVGLCQMGAMDLARIGSPTKQILLHYYPGTTITTLWK